MLKALFWYFRVKIYCIFKIDYARPFSGTAGVRLAVFRLNSTLLANFRGHSGVDFIGYARLPLRFKCVRINRLPIKRLYWLNIKIFLFLLSNVFNKILQKSNVLFLIFISFIQIRWFQNYRDTITFNKRFIIQFMLTWLTKNNISDPVRSFKILLRYATSQCEQMSF